MEAVPAPQDFRTDWLTERKGSIPHTAVADKDWTVGHLGSNRNEPEARRRRVCIQGRAKTYL